MKPLSILCTLMVITLFSCQGPTGPEGPRGDQGPQGNPGADGLEGFTFEYIVDFTAPDYASTLTFPETFQMLESDVALVYFLWGNDNGLDIWRQIPQTLLLNEGTLLYNFDFTMNDVLVFMEADFDMSILGADFTDDWIVRVVVVPAQFANNGRIAGVDLSDYYAVKEYFNLIDRPVDEYYQSIKRPEVK